MPEFNFPKLFEPIAIVGMEVRINGILGLDELFQIIYTGEPAGTNQTAAQTAQLKPNGRHLLDLAIEKALSNARMDLSVSPDIKLGFLIFKIENKGQSGDVFSKWRQIGPVMDFSTLHNPIQAMLHQASQWLSTGVVQVVVLVAESQSKANGWSAIVLKKVNKAYQDGNTIYTLIKSVGVEPGNGAPSPEKMVEGMMIEAIKHSALTALTMAGITSEEIGYLETFVYGPDKMEGEEINGLCQVYQGNDLVSALGSLQTRIDFSDTASGIAAIVKTALCLHHRIIPVCYPRPSHKFSDRWARSQFYVPTDSRPWFQPDDHLPRMAAVNIIESYRACTHLILSDSARPIKPSNPALRQTEFYLLPVSANHSRELLEHLATLRNLAEQGHDVAALADQYYNHHRQQPDATCTVGIVAHHPAELLREVDMAIKGIPIAIEKKTEWQTPNGSYFTPNPQGQKGKLAFVYPGAFNSYPGMGKDLFTLFPQLYQNMGTITRDIGNKLREKLVYPRSQSTLDDESLKKIETVLQADAIAMLITGTSMAFLLTSVLRDVFSIQPTAAFGYSLGELSMAFATGVWNSADECSTRLESSPVFVDRLAGPQNAVREAWGLPAQAPQYRSNLWSNYVLMATPAAVMEQVEHEERVYMTHINTPRQVVIGGDPAACQRVIAAIHCSALQAPFNYALHCDAMRSEYDGLVYLHTWPVQSIPDVTLYSASGYAPAKITETGLGQGIARALVNPLDFPRLIYQVYLSGIKIFIEVGAGSNCTRWIDETLKDQPHAALSVNRRGADDQTSILRLLSRLISHQVKVDLSPLYRQDNFIPVAPTAEEDWQSWL